MATVFETENLSITYNGHAALRGVSVRLEEGAVVGIAGESGSGKTSLIHATLGALGPNGAVAEGSIRLQGRDIAALSAKERRVYLGQVAGLVPQSPQHAFSPVRTIGSQFQEALAVRRGLKKDEALAYSAQLLGRLGFADAEEVLGKYAFELSGGMAQRAAVGLALATGPKVLFADEPTSALDTVSQAQVVEELQKVNRELGVSVLVVSHNLAVLGRLASYLYVMKEGSIVEEGPTQRVMQQPENPYTKQLLAAVPRFGGMR